MLQIFPAFHVIPTPQPLCLILVSFQLLTRLMALALAMATEATPVSRCGFKVQIQQTTPACFFRRTAKQALSIALLVGLKLAQSALLLTLGSNLQLLQLQLLLAVHHTKKKAMTNQT